MNDVVKATAPMWADDLAGLIALLKKIANGEMTDEVIAPELCQIPAHICALLAAELEAY